MPFREPTNGDKAENEFSPLYPHSPPHGGLLRTPLTSLAARRKSRFAEKKSATPKKTAAIACRAAVYGDAGRRGTAVVKLLVGAVQFASEIGRVKIKDFNIWMLNLGHNL